MRPATHRALQRVEGIARGAPCAPPGHSVGGSLFITDHPTHAMKICFDDTRLSPVCSLASLWRSASVARFAHTTTFSVSHFSRTQRQAGRQHALGHWIAHLGAPVPSPVVPDAILPSPPTTYATNFSALFHDRHWKKRKESQIALKVLMTIISCVPIF